MTPEQKVAYIQAKVVYALSEIEAMKATNQERISNGKALAYGEHQFREVTYELGLNPEEVVKFLEE